MSVVIVGGHDRMVQQYKQVCKAHRCKAKVFTKKAGNLGNQIGSPDAIIIFTNTVSHKTVNSASKEAKRSGIPVQYLKSSSGSALTALLESYDA